MTDIPIPVLGFSASLAAGIATGLGAIPVLFFRNISRQLQDIMMGFGAGVMIGFVVMMILDVTLG